MMASLKEGPLEEQFKELADAIESGKRLWLALDKRISDLKSQYTFDLAKITQELGVTKVDPEQFKAFFNKPYVTIPRKENEWYLIVPRFINFQMGWLYRQDESFNIFIVNRYVDWLYPLPADLKKELEFKDPDVKAKVDQGYLVVEPKETDVAFQKYRPYVTRREEPGRIKVNPNKEFDLICQLIRDGILPFTKKSVDPKDLRDMQTEIQLRDYQEEAWKQFQEWGNVGIYWSPGVGKMFLALWALAHLKGRKLVITPTRTLVEEWTRKIKNLLPQSSSYEITVSTLASAHKHLGTEYTLVVFDEHQHLPADTYAKLALVKSKYRMGLTATPFREDGRVDMIFALTGYPIGLSWEQFFKLGVIQKPVAYLFIVANRTQKVRLLKTLIQEHTGRTLVFSDSLELGREAAQLLNAPFVHGGSSHRLYTIGRSEVTVISRVGDEGIDITDLKNVVEIDFLFGSRRQELQRLGRLLHSRFKGFYAIIMTEEEHQSYSKRLLSLYEKGFQIKVEKRNG